jgi:ribosome-associated translation inhibitor RaiA
VIGSTASRPPFPVTLDNWQTAAQIGWTFCHIAEIFPTAIISPGSEAAAPLLRRTEPLPDLPCRTRPGVRALSARSLAATNTDGWKRVCASAPASQQPTGCILEALSALAPHLSGWEHDRVDLEVSLKDTEGQDQKVTLQAWLAGRAYLVATSHKRDLDHALAEVRRDLIRQIEEERSRREPRKRRKTRYRTA